MGRSGIATGVVLSCVGFLLGQLWIHWSVDHGLLWTNPVTRDAVHWAQQYYLSRLHDPSDYSKFWGLAVCPCLALLAIFWKLRTLAASRIMFDGASLILMVTIASIYLFQVRPFLSQLAALPFPSEEEPLRNEPLISYPTQFLKREKALLTSIAASHTIIATALCGIIALQSGEWYAERAIEREEAQDREDARKKRERRASSSTPKSHSRTSSLTGNGSRAEVESPKRSAKGKKRQ